jgi:hypothetical protein
LRVDFSSTGIISSLTSLSLLYKRPHVDFLDHLQAQVINKRLYKSDTDADGTLINRRDFEAIYDACDAYATLPPNLRALNTRSEYSKALSKDKKSELDVEATKKAWRLKERR